jgi:hypothetical protein
MGHANYHRAAQCPPASAVSPAPRPPLSVKSDYQHLYQVQRVLVLLAFIQRMRRRFECLPAAQQSTHTIAWMAAIGGSHVSKRAVISLVESRRNLCRQFQNHFGTVTSNLRLPGFLHLVNGKSITDQRVGDRKVTVWRTTSQAFHNWSSLLMYQIEHCLSSIPQPVGSLQATSSPGVATTPQLRGLQTACPLVRRALELDATIWRACLTCLPLDYFQTVA